MWLLILFLQITSVVGQSETTGDSTKVLSSSFSIEFTLLSQDQIRVKYREETVAPDSVLQAYIANRISTREYVGDRVRGTLDMYLGDFNSKRHISITNDTIIVRVQAEDFFDRDSLEINIWPRENSQQTRLGELRVQSYDRREITGARPIPNLLEQDKSIWWPKANTDFFHATVYIASNVGVGGSQLQLTIASLNSQLHRITGFLYYDLIWFLPLFLLILLQRGWIPKFSELNTVLSSKPSMKRWVQVFMAWILTSFFRSNFVTSSLRDLFLFHHLSEDLAPVLLLIAVIGLLQLLTRIPKSLVQLVATILSIAGTIAYLYFAFQLELYGDSTFVSVAVGVLVLLPWGLLHRPWGKPTWRFFVEFILRPASWALGYIIVSEMLSTNYEVQTYVQYFPFLLILYGYSRILSAFGVRWRYLWIIITILFLSYPLLGSTSYESFYYLRTWQYYHVSRQLFYWLPAFILLWVLRTEDESSDHLFLFTCGIFLFVFYMVFVAVNLFWVPVAIVLANWLTRNRIVFHRRNKLKAILDFQQRYLSDRIKWFLDFNKLLDYKRLVGLNDVYKRKLLAGDIDSEEYKHKTEALEKYLQGYTPPDEEVRLGTHFGPYPNFWRNGLHGGGYFLVLSIPLLLLNINKSFEGLSGGLLALQIIPTLLLVFGTWFKGFFFGYFFPLIRGQFGWQKGLFLGLAIEACNLISVMLADSTGVLDAIPQMLTRMLVFVLLGYLFFDFWTANKFAGTYFQPQIIFRMQGLKGVISSLSTITAGVLAALVSYYSGQIPKLIEGLYQDVERQEHIRQPEASATEEVVGFLMYHWDMVIGYFIA